MSASRSYSAALTRSMKAHSLMESLPYGSPEWKKAEAAYRAAEREMASICANPAPPKPKKQPS